MKTATLPDIIALNDRLAAMAAAEVPLSRDLVRSNAELPTTLHEVSAAVSRRVEAGQTLEQSLAAEERLTPAYHLLLQISANSNDRGGALSRPQRLANSSENSAQILSRALTYPLIVCSLAYCGLALFCLYLVPTLEQLYGNLRIPTGWALRLLTGLRITLPYWIALPPVLLSLIVWLLRRQSNSGGWQQAGAWLPGMRRVIREQQCSAFADSIANLLAAGMPFESALRLNIETSNDPIFSRSLGASAASMTRNAHTAVEDAFVHLPPFLRWALFRSEPLLDRVSALRLAADLYYEAAQRRISRMRIAVPIVFSAVLGGGVTLLYALALFVPLAHLLRSIAAS
ncbi:type II secretion system F family protein [Anatilimnocola floriformis]|uniref:type II secretion system F family protein n=1 Tax=Anatilimnocola floriformis TaxID=2948575 RepID=UPI0020C2478D|nr:type II secretion system F family protein [Anatilimnocola floriformis]